MSHPLWILAVLAGATAASEWLARRSALRHLGSALLVIVLTAVAANLRVIPSVTDGSPVYDTVFDTLGPLAIFWLLLQVRLRSILQAGPAVLGLFLLGTVGTLVGVLVGMFLAGGEATFGSLHAALGGMFVGTYVGGSINFNAVALEYDVMRDGVLYAGAAVVDNVATTIWMVVTVVLPRLLMRTAAVRGEREPRSRAEVAVGAADRDVITAEGLAVLLALGAGALLASQAISAGFEAYLSLPVPSILILTTLALVLAQVPAVGRLGGTHLVGWTAVMVFLAAIGALCDLRALVRLGALAPGLLVLVGTTLVVHGVVVFGGAAALRLDPAVAAVASQANIGGGTSALALARSLDREDLELPAILVGSLGNALGTYVGFLAVALLR